MLTHTPGPWYIGRNMHPFSENFMKPTIGAEGREDAIAVLPSGDDPDEEGNAALIAAAPELLEACQALLEYFDISEVYEAARRQAGLDWLTIARAAIAKLEKGDYS